jgi:Cu(I)/Ag(I) efflux system membrane fusion protein
MKYIKFLLPGLFVTALTAILLCLPGCSKENGKVQVSEKTENHKKEYYTCTMHPQVISDKPGVCPICGMELVKKVVEESDQSSGTDQKDMEGMVSLSGRKLVLANVSIVKIGKELLTKEISSYSYLDFAEQNRMTISARFNGRIEKLFVNKTGDYVKKGQPLFEVYSPDLVQAQNDYLIALKGAAQGTNYNNTSSVASLNTSVTSGGDNILLKSSRKRLELLGLTDNQIHNLETTGDIKLTLTYYSPYSGTVIDKKVQEGMYVNEGATIYEIADLSTLWNIAEVYESDLAAVKQGSSVKLHLKAYPGEEFEGRVTFIYPVVDQQTRTVKIRSEFANRNNRLKPQMYGETIFSSSSGQGMLIPADAIIFTGKRSVVWVKTVNPVNNKGTGTGSMFEAREIRTGGKYGDKYEAMSGLNEGDEVAATGGFLIDSESQLKSSSPTGHQHDDTKNNEGAGNSDDMKDMKGM